MNKLFLRIYARMLVVTIIVCLGGLFAFNQLNNLREQQYTKSQLSGLVELIKDGLNVHKGNKKDQITWLRFASDLTGLNFKLNQIPSQDSHFYSVSLLNNNLKNIAFSINNEQQVTFEFHGFNRQLFEGINKLIFNALAKKPQPLREVHLEKITRWFMADIELIHKDQISITNYEMAQLNNGLMVYRFSQTDGIITFSQFANSPIILKVGPTLLFNPYPIYWILLLTTLILIITLTASWFLFKPFANRLKKLADDVNNVAILDKLGNTSLDITISQKGDDALALLSQEVDQMAKRVISLVKDQQNLSRSISHEFRTPIVKMGYRIAMLEESKQLSANHADMFKKNMSELHYLVDELLLYSSLEFNTVETPVKMNLYSVIHILQKELQPLSDINIMTNCPENLTILGNEQYWKTILQNLLTNAQRYAKSTIELSVEIKNKQLIVTVSDDGVGIEEKHLKNIFEPFFVVEQSRNKKMAGHGLGLSIVKRMTLLQKGKIEVSNNALGGAQFKMTFESALIDSVDRGNNEI